MRRREAYATSGPRIVVRTLLSGKGSVRGFVVGNREGLQTDQALELNHAA